MYKFESVTLLNEYVRDLFAEDDRLSGFELSGEISEFKIAASGHCYFKIKDNKSSVSCVMFRMYFRGVDFEPKIGDEVTVMGSADLYPAAGSFQVQVIRMSKKGKGDLYEQYQLLCEQLRKEGLFDQEHKLAIPVLPRKIGVITSPSGAVIHDITETLNRRNPHYHLVVYPAAVQGVSCPEEVCRGLEYFEKTHDVDVVIVARGGGSYEDLFGFNHESIARMIYSMTIPVISAIGHDVDYTICDHVADLRAPTPTAAAELVLGNYDKLTNDVNNASAALDIAVEKFIESRRQIIHNFANHKALASPLFYAAQKKSEIDSISDKIDLLIQGKIANEKAKISSISENLESLNPVNVLLRGYSFVSGPDGSAVESVEDIAVGSEVTIRFSDGSADASIKKINGQWR